MKIDSGLVDKISSLCRIGFSEEEKAGFVDDFTKIINYVEKISDMDVEGEEPAVWGNSDVSMMLREDE
jgi:aspartyl-tRNA(Asn)/glutamyl-tRNA(Gln) amidotransferase subunit C